MHRRDVRPALRPFVASVWATDGGDGDAGARGVARELSLPTGAMHVAIRLDAPLRVHADLDDRIGREVGLAVVGGARTRPYVRDISRPVTSVGAMLRPGAARLLFGVPAGELADRHTRLDDLWGAGGVEIARERIARAATPAARLDAFEDELAARLPRVRGVHPAVAHALAQLDASAEIRAIVDETGYSHRRFIALFRDEVGLAPKQYARVRRLQRALALLSQTPRDLARIALAAGYADQSHWNREFRALTALSPGRYRALAPALINHVPLRDRSI